MSSVGMTGSGMPQRVRGGTHIPFFRHFVMQVWQILTGQYGTVTVRCTSSMTAPTTSSFDGSTADA
jgi:hypothetical protein